MKRLIKMLVNKILMKSSRTVKIVMKKTAKTNQKTARNRALNQKMPNQKELLPQTNRQKLLVLRRPRKLFLRTVQTLMTSAKQPLTTSQRTLTSLKNSNNRSCTWSAIRMWYLAFRNSLKEAIKSPKSFPLVTLQSCLYPPLKVMPSNKIFWISSLVITIFSSKKTLK